jgi:hypothetical protein
VTAEKFKLRFSEEAFSELGQASHWYEENRKGLGSEFLNSVDATIAAIRRVHNLKITDHPF